MNFQDMDCDGCGFPWKTDIERRSAPAADRLPVGY